MIVLMVKIMKFILWLVCLHASVPMGFISTPWWIVPRKSTSTQINGHNKCHVQSNTDNYYYQYTLTDLKCLAASSHICIPLDSLTWTDPRYWKRKQKITLFKCCLFGWSSIRKSCKDIYYDSQNTFCKITYPWQQSQKEMFAFGNILQESSVSKFHTVNIFKMARDLTKLIIFCKILNFGPANMILHTSKWKV